MRVSSYNPRDRYKRKSSEQMLAFGVVLFILFLAFAVGFFVGSSNSTQSGEAAIKQNEELLNQREELQDQVTALSAEIQTLQTRIEQQESEFKEAMPEGPLRELVSLLKKSLDEGKDPQRLAFMLQSGRAPRNCTEPDTKRFVVSTPAYEGPVSEVSLEEGALVVTGKGRSSSNEEGQPEAWYDPTKMVEVQFKTAEGQKTKKGTLPIRHSIVVNDREYRLTIARGAQSFAKIVYDSCDYP